MNDFAVIGELDGVAASNYLELDIFFTRYTYSKALKHVHDVREVLGFSPDKESQMYQTVHAGCSNAALIASLQGVSETDNHLSTIDAAFTSEDIKPTAATGNIAAPPTIELRLVVKALHLSSWNPPTSQRRLQGDLFYLDVVSQGDVTYNITAHYLGFYWNQSTEEKFDPTRRDNNKSGSKMHHSLLLLLKEILPSVEFGLRQNTGRFEKIAMEALMAPTQCFLAAPWLVEPEEHRPDLGLPQYSAQPLASEDTNWTERVELVRELPKTALNDKLFREKKWQEVCFQFAQAATKGAVEVARGDIPPCNPEDAESSWFYLHNGILFSYCQDGNGKLALKGGDIAARKAAGKEVSAVNYLNRLDIEGLCTVPTTVIDYCGRRIIAQAKVPGTFPKVGPAKSRVIYGSMNGEVLFDPKFDNLMQKLGKACLTRPHGVFDEEGNFLHTAPVSQEINGVLGLDNRMYIMGLHRIAPLDLNFVHRTEEDGHGEYPNKLATLRMEVVQEWWRQNTKGLREEQFSIRQAKTDGETDGPVAWDAEDDERVINQAMLQFGVNTDVPASLTDVPKGLGESEYIRDGQLVFDMSFSVAGRLIPDFIHDIHREILPFPLDGAHLTALMHSRGISMRYLGILGEQLETTGKEAKESTFATVLQRIVTMEIIARAAKHCINAVTAKLPIEIVPSVVVHYFLCLLGPANSLVNFQMTLDPMMIPLVDENVIGALTPKAIHEAVALAALTRFRCKLDNAWHETVKLVGLFRSLSLKLGLQWRSRVYNFDHKEQLHGHNTKKNKKKRNQFFNIDDLLNIVPVVKYSTVQSQLAEETMQQAAQEVHLGNSKKGLDLLVDSVQLHDFMYGLVHPKSALVYAEIAEAYAGMRSFPLACSNLRLAWLLQERVAGHDSYQALSLAANLAKLEHERGSSSNALVLFKHVFKFYNAFLEVRHPAVAFGLINVASILQSRGLHSRALPLYSRARCVIMELYGTRWGAFVALNFQIAHSQVGISDYDGAIESLTAALHYQEADAGPEDLMTMKIAAALERFQRAKQGYDISKAEQAEFEWRQSTMAQSMADDPEERKKEMALKLLSSMDPDALSALLKNANLSTDGEEVAANNDANKSTVGRRKRRGKK